jgi:hypothetical protein
LPYRFFTDSRPRQSGSYMRWRRCCAARY